MNQVRISVIYPVYNGQKYIKQSLESILNQTLRDIEVICIDDGSTDNTLRILNEYKRKDGRIIVLHQENKYAGIARNNGMRCAKGKYLAFMDADDWFEPDALEHMYKQAEKDAADVCVCELYNHYTVEGFDFTVSGQGIAENKLPPVIPFNIKTSPEHIIDFTNSISENKIILREFIEKNNIKYTAHRNGEDVFFTAVSLSMAERITVVKKSLTHYHTHPGSLSTTVSEASLDPFKAFAETYAYLSEKNILSEQSFANRAFDASLSVLRKMTTVESLNSAVKYLQNGGLAAMGIREQEPGYYGGHWKDTLLQHMIHDKPEQFVLNYLKNTTYRMISSQEKVKKLKRKTSGLRAKLDTREKQYAELNKELQQAKNRIRKRTAEKNKLLNSKSYKLGHALLKFPRKIYRLLNKSTRC